MKTTIDAAGRIVVPKALRGQFQLGPGSELEIEATGDGVIIRAPDRGPSLVDSAGVLVHHGPQTTDLDIAAFVRQKLGSRVRHIGRPRQPG